jgi:hypothetical protein
MAIPVRSRRATRVGALTGRETRFSSTAQIFSKWPLRACRKARPWNLRLNAVKRAHGL